MTSRLSDNGTVVEPTLHSKLACGIEILHGTMMPFTPLEPPQLPQKVNSASNQQSSKVSIDIGTDDLYEMSPRALVSKDTYTTTDNQSTQCNGNTTFTTSIDDTLSWVTNNVFSTTVDNHICCDGASPLLTLPSGSCGYETVLEPGAGIQGHAHLATFLSTPTYPFPEEWFDTYQSRWFNIPEADSWQKEPSMIRQETVLYASSSSVQSTTASVPRYQLVPDVGHACALLPQPRSVMGDSGRVNAPLCMQDSISSIPSISHSPTIDSSPISISSTISVSSNLMPMISCVTDDSAWNTGHSLTDLWDTFPPNSTHKALYGFYGIESLAHAVDLPGIIFESYLHSPPPPPDLAVRSAGAPEPLNSLGAFHFGSVPEDDLSQTSGFNQERLLPRDTFRSIKSDNKTAPRVVLAQPAQRGDITLLKSGKLGQNRGMPANHEPYTLEAGCWPELQPSMDMLSPVQYPLDICGNGQQLWILGKHEPWVEGNFAEHAHVPGDAIREQEQEVSWEARHETVHGLSQCPFLLHSQEEECEDPYQDTILYHPGQCSTDVKYSSHGGGTYGYLKPHPSTLKRRRRLSAEETAFLISQFRQNEKPTAQERQIFAKHLNLDRRTIQVWFQNRRAKLKREEMSAGIEK